MAKNKKDPVPTPLYDALNDSEKAQIDAKIFLEIYDERHFRNLSGPFNFKATERRVQRAREKYSEEMKQPISPELQKISDMFVYKALTLWREHKTKNLFPISDLIAVLDNLPPLDTHLRRVLAKENSQKGASR